jgi:hypothetical protein
MGTCFSDCLDEFNHKRESKKLQRNTDLVSSRFQHALSLQEGGVQIWKRKLAAVDKSLQSIKATVQFRSPPRFTRQEQRDLLVLFREKMTAMQSLRRHQSRMSSLDKNRNTAMSVIVEQHVAKAEQSAISQLRNQGVDLERVREMRDENADFMGDLHDTVQEFDADTEAVNVERDDDELLKQMLQEFMSDTIGTESHTFSFDTDGRMTQSQIQALGRDGVEYATDEQYEEEDDLLSLGSLPVAPGNTSLLPASSVKSHEDAVIEMT